MHIQELSKFGLSESVISKLKELGFETLTQAQEAAIQKGLFDKKNLLVNAPTNTGKTFIGELAALNASRQKEPKRSFFLVPLKALAEQMFQSFVEKYETWGLKVAISTSDHYEFDNALMDFDVIISTYEKLNALLVKKPEITRDIGLVVVDEIQHVGNRDRGIPLEMLLTKLRISTKDVQIIGLSATISNAEALAKWLDSRLVQIDKRDVDLREGALYTGSESIKFRGFTLNKGDFLYREFNSGKIDVERELNLNSIPKIVEQSKKEQCLVFVSTQPKAEETAQRIARDLPELPEMHSMIEELDTLVESTPSTTKMKKVLKKGVAFHHAGLLADERRIVESGFGRGLIKVICSTPTLGAGVNTPAKNVIILFRKYYNGSNMLVATYKNISGRAGRLRKAEEFGRSLLLADNERELEFLWDNYINAKPEAIVSQITRATGLDCSILGLISSKTCSSRDELMFCMEMTFFGFQVSEQSPSVYKKILASTLNREVDRLVKMGFVTENDKLETTELGLRCAEELLSPETTLFLYQTIGENEVKIQKSVNYENLISGIIHLCCCTSDAQRLFPPRSKAETQELVATWEFEKDSYFFKPLDEEIFLRSLRTVRMLLRWIEGVPYFELSPYAPPGVIKRTAETTQWISRGLAHLAEKPLFSFKDEFSDFLSELSERIYFGVPREALSIMRLRVNGIHRRRALNLAKAGYHDIDSLLEADIEDLKKVDDIGDVLALRLKESVEKYIENESLRKKSVQIRLASGMNKNLNLILGLYDTHGDDFSKHLTKLFKEEFKIDATFVGESGEHEPDILISEPDGNVVIEAKRKESGRVSALESEEILGKGAKYKPIAHVTIGYPDFVEVAKENANSSKITLITAAMIGEILTQFWKGGITAANILSLLKSSKYVYELGSYCLK